MAVGVAAVVVIAATYGRVVALRGRAPAVVVLLQRRRGEGLGVDGVETSLDQGLDGILAAALPR